MKLITEKGELALPEDFSFEIVQNSAFFSEDGAATLAATIPSTSEDQARLGFPARIARAQKFTNLFPCTLSHGIFQKKGVIVVDSASRNGMVCSIALEDSEFYSQYKDQNIKELFSSKILKDYSTPSGWYDWLMKVYRGEVDCDLQLVPVAVSGGKAEEYIILNAPVFNKNDEGIWPLVHEARIISEGDDRVSVPEGYGITPFLKLKDFIEQLFEQCGYHVRNNCFRTNSILSSLLLLNNCADTICDGQLDYSDLVPSMKVSEFLEWMKCKFLAQIEVYPSEKAVDVILLKDILKAPYDLNLTDRIIGQENYTFSKPSRLVLTPDTSLENAGAAAETLPDLIEKYKYVHCRKAGYPERSSGLELILSTGVFFENKTTVNGVKTTRLGTNYFKYDRRNSEISEEYNTDDVAPVMVWAEGFLMPFIGDRVHRNTTYQGSEKDEKQPVIIADYAGRSVQVIYSANQPAGTDRPSRVPVDEHGSHYCYATTQKYDNSGELRPGKISLIPEELFFEFFQEYNNILLNNSVKMDARFDLHPEEIFQYRLYSRKLIDGQHFLPLSIDYEVGKKLACRKASFLLLKEYRDNVEDQPIEFIEPKYKWVLNDSELTAKAAELRKTHLPPRPGNSSIRYKWAADDEWKDGKQDFSLPTPTKAGEKSSKILRRVEYFVVTRPSSSSQSRPQETWSSIGVWSLYEWYDSVDI